MKKLLCAFLSLVILLSFAACSGEKKETKSDEEQIEELIINRHKVIVAVATKEELKSTLSEAYWEKHSLDEYYDRLINSAFASIDGSESKSGEEILKEKVGDNYKFSVEIKELTFYDNKEELAKMEEIMEKVYNYELDGFEQYCTVTCVVRVQGDKDVHEWEYNGADGSTQLQFYKIDGKWCAY